MDFNQFDVNNGECHSIGRPWTAKEVYAVRNLGIDANLVRQGILTKEQNPVTLVQEVIKTDVENIGVAQVSTEDEKTPDLSPETEQSLEEIQLAYTEIVGKIPARYKNDITRLKNKILSTK